MKEFLDIYELAHLKVTSLHEEQILAEKIMPNFYNSKISKIFIHCVKHIYFRYFFDLSILVNAICLGFDQNGGMHDNPGSWYPSGQLGRAPTMWNNAYLPFNYKKSILFKFYFYNSQSLR